MIFAGFVARIHDILAKRREYKRLVSDIQNLTQRDLVDIRGDRSDMLHAAYRQVYGQAD